MKAATDEGSVSRNNVNDRTTSEAYKHRIGALINHHDRPRAFDKADAQDRVSKIGLGLVTGLNSVMFRGRAVSQPSHLRKDKPHPMRSLAACLQFRKDFRIDFILCGDKASEVERIVHCECF
jgi:hypothetical protein